ncbi:MAG TPA: 3-deoxy-D-manno-octulosonate 8-phosphate phosphatase [Firmicutes bacterium]|nr:3-deoxy-D-manno-octulosonate 8-phosphate phosphatase [Bacillota bacterium]
MEIDTRARRIKLLAMDVDGVLTDGHIILGNQGEELKAFHVHDGLGINLAHKAGLHTAIITGRESEIVRQRGTELNIRDIHQKVADKARCIKQMLAKYALTPDEVAFIGDDLNDVPLFLQVGLAAAVANAAPEAKQFAHVVTRARGGDGAVRELIALILKAQGKWEQIVEEYVNSPQRLIGQ